MATIHGINSIRYGDWIPVLAPKLLGTIARVAFDVFSFMACCLVLLALFKRKRTYVPAPPPPLTLDVGPIIEISPSELPFLPDKDTWEFARKIVVEIFETTAKGGVELIRARTHLLTIGKQIEKIHPFAFLYAVPPDKARIIFQGWTPDMVGSNWTITSNIGAKLELKKSENEIDRHLPSFAAAMKKDVELIRQKIDENDWNSLVNYLYDV